MIEKHEQIGFVPFTALGQIIAVDTYYGDNYTFVEPFPVHITEQLIDCETEEIAIEKFTDELMDIVGSQEFMPAFEMRKFKITIEEIS
jgi:hypothetical protein